MKKNIWLFISSFGIMFAVLSWMQESNMLANSDQIGYLKGLYAIISGFVLFILFKDSL